MFRPNRELHLKSLRVRRDPLDHTYFAVREIIHAHQSQVTLGLRIEPPPFHSVSRDPRRRLPGSGFCASHISPK